jgi:hypothetical protein
VVSADAQASVSDPDSRSDGDLSSAPLRGASRVMITVRMAQMVITPTVRYPVPGGVSQSRSLKMINP